MTLIEYNFFCAALPATTHVVQWGEAQVWKVGGKVFCVAHWPKTAEDRHPTFSFRTSEIGFEVLREREGYRPAPYLASRGLRWIQAYALPEAGDPELREHIRQSHAIVAVGLSRKRRRELGLA